MIETSTVIRTSCTALLDGLFV